MRTRFFRCQLPLMFTCGLLPIPLVMCSFWGQGALTPWLIPPLAYLLLAVLSLLLPGKWRLAAAIPGTILLAAGAFWLLRDEHYVLRGLVPLLYTLLMILTLPIAGWERGHEPPTTVPAVLVCIHLFAQFFLFVNPPRFPVISPMLTVSFLVFLLLMMLSMNRQSIANAMPESHTVPTSIRRRNRLLTCILMGLVCLISLIPALGKAVDKVKEWLKMLIRALIDFFMSLFATEESSGGGGSAEDMLQGLGTGEASDIAKFLEKILVVITVIGLFFVLLWVLRFLWRKLKQLARYLYDQLRHYANTASEDYEDEVEDTREQGGDAVSIAQKLLRRRSAQRGLKDLPPREQIRMRYGLLRGKHPEWAASDTARDTLSEASARLYEKARYSSHEVTVDDSEAFAKQQGK